MGATTTITPQQLDQTKTSLSKLGEEIVIFNNDINRWLQEITNSWDDDKVRKLQEEYKANYGKALTQLNQQIVDFNKHITSVQEIYQTLSNTDY
ncbi:hypothetical protein [Paenibacillus sp. FSL H7-0331]|uniref:hypothetical protein n=1 Tax=Paenibacillus sp. FSL H7-0331 TaxID=1920421 RepID=UPI00096D03D1|nr:hypothetical protein [Paenibacillus sp. FSL H7-0331]OMF02876.1 hypothetical protein BK127_36555 [Paenibacillus sp. FSL H7-0331]